MKGKFPKIVNWLTYEEQPDGTYLVKDRICEDVYIVGKLAFRLLRSLDGKTDPYGVVPELSEADVDGLLCEFENEELVRYSRVLDKAFPLFTVTLWTAKQTEGRRTIFGILDTMRMMLWGPVFLLGWYLFWHYQPRLSSESVWMGTILGVLLGAILHEVSHVISCLRWDGAVFEGGIMLRCGIFFGLYTRMDTAGIQKRRHRALVNFAGVEANLMLAGVCFLLAMAVPHSSRSFFVAASMNVLLAMTNLLPVIPSDGRNLLYVLLGND